MGTTVELFCESCNTERDTEKINGIAGPSQPPGGCTVVEIATKLLVNTLGDVERGGERLAYPEKKCPH